MKPNYPVIRGEILKILYSAHPDWCNIKLIQFTLDDLGYVVSEEAIASELHYLTEKIDKVRPLVELQEKQIPGRKQKMLLAKITAWGIDLIENRLEIPDADKNWIVL